MDLAAMYVAGSVFLFVIGLLWIALPFAVFGTKPILQAVLKETKATNELLRAQGDRQKKLLEELELQSVRLLELKGAVDLQAKTQGRPPAGG